MSDHSATVRGHGRPTPQGTVTVTFDYTGAAQSWTVPAGVTEATFLVNGAAGGPDNQGGTGPGGQAEATVAVTPGAVYAVVVGGAGQSIAQAPTEPPRASTPAPACAATRRRSSRAPCSATS